jgi:hypothetical protein
MGATMTGLVLNKAEKHLTLYRDMCSAISACHRIDECKDIADKSVALAAYYKQIKDTKTVQMFYEVRLRSWRQVGKLFKSVDTSKCETLTAKYAAIRAAFRDDETMRDISDSRMREIFELTALSDSDFEHAIGQELTTGSVSELIRHSPQHQEMVRQNFERMRSPPPPPTPEQIERERAAEAAAAAARLKAAIEQRHVAELELASDAAMKEVGLTLERKDRAKMKQVVFLIKNEVHAVMRQAAFDQKITMQEVLRRGLKMWLIAHDYEFPEG